MQIYTMNDYAKDTFGKKLYKLSLDGGFSCPNRDGTMGYGGCIFCSSGGSGDFAGLAYGSLATGNGGADCAQRPDSAAAIPDIGLQLQYQKELIAPKLRGKSSCEYGYIAYFQAYSGTYGEVERLRAIYMQAAADREVEVISIATRPDCLPLPVLELLQELNRIKPVWIELGLQSANEHTAEYIHRGYPGSVYQSAVAALKSIGIAHIITHMIIGLLGETMVDYKNTLQYIIDAGSRGIKLQFLYILKGTPLEREYYCQRIKVLTLEEYIQILIPLLKLMPDDMVIHRLTGDGPKRILIAPLWSGDKKKVLNTINASIRQA